MTYKILFRKSLAEENEFSAANKYFDVIESRTKVNSGDIIIGRYSVLPYYNELSEDLKNNNATLINSILSHQLVSDLGNWYPHFEDLTPKSWLSLSDALSSSYPGPFVLKGAINSRKQLWKTHMFAENVKAMKEVYFRLMDDSLIQHQGVVIREFVDLINYGRNVITGCPISKEFRLFVLNGEVVAKGYYWSCFAEEAENPDPNEIPESLIKDVISRIDCPFWMVDIAQKINGEWIVVELGDAQMGGLSCITSENFYRQLSIMTK